MKKDIVRLISENREFLTLRKNKRKMKAEGLWEKGDVVATKHSTMVGGCYEMMSQEFQGMFYFKSLVTMTHVPMSKPNSKLFIIQTAIHLEKKLYIGFRRHCSS